MSADPAANLGRYRLIRLVGRGGMGEVHLAHDEMLDRDVAIKFVALDRRGDDSARRRLLREAHAAAALDHPYICTIYETGETPDGAVFFVMQYVDGEPLSDVLSRGAMPVREALRLCVDIAEALGAAHRAGVVHRDLKPSNIVIMPSGRPKLLDFGLAKLVPHGGGSDDGSTTTSETAAGTIVGTPAFMAPEQIQQQPVDARSDLFSLGAVLYECLTGRRAFRGATTFETIASVLHVDPKPPSVVRPELTASHDELCHRLLAKLPEDRFQSTEEVIGALRLLLTDSARTGPSDPGVPLPVPTRVSALLRRSRPWLAAAAVLAALAAAWWVAARPSPLPVVPAEADVWYRRGTEAIREGAYHTGRTALEEAVARFPGHVLAYARLAEAYAELDDQRAAQNRLLRVSMLVPNESRLPEPERVRLQAVRALVVRDVDEAIARFRRLAELSPGDAGVWLDVGRAQEAAGLRAAARESYARAIQIDGQYAAAHVRLGRVEALESRLKEALAAFDEAERLYRASSNFEGLTEVLLRRAAALDAFGHLERARTQAERARQLAAESQTVSQQLRAQLLLSSITASQGDLAAALAAASDAVSAASAAGLDTVAAEGLIDLAITLQWVRRPEEAEAQARRAVQLAEDRGARLTAARARLQLAAIHESHGRAESALEEVEAVLPFLQDNKYRRYELLALSIAARAHQRRDALDRAEAMAAGVLSAAERLEDDAQIALAASNLASVVSALGRLPEALALRERAEGIHRQQGDRVALPYGLANKADLLIQLGRTDDARAALDELDAGIREGMDAYVGRAPRVRLLRAFASITQRSCSDALKQLDPLGAHEAADATGILAPAFRSYCGRRITPAAAELPEHAEASLERERCYWMSAAALRRRDPATASTEARRGLDSLGDLPNDELRWRLAALAAAAATEEGDDESAARMAQTAGAALRRLRDAWTDGDEGSYAARQDLVELRERVDR